MDFKFVYKEATDKMGDTYRQEALCINKVRYIASQFFHSEFIEFPGRIDNGLDGAIFS